MKRKKAVTATSPPPRRPEVERNRLKRLGVLLILLVSAGITWGWQRAHRASAAEQAAAEGMAALGHRDTETAQRAFRRALQIQPRLATAHTQLGRLALAEGDAEAALQHFAAAVASRREDAEAVADLAIARLESGDWAEAVRTFQQALQIAPRSQQALRGLGEAYRRGQRWDAAVIALEKALRQSPDDAKTQYVLGLTLAQRGRAPEDPRRAIALLTAARHGGMDAVAIQYGTGLARLAQGQIPEAIRDLEATARATPEDDQALFHLGDAYRRAGRLQEAERTLAEHNARYQRRRALRSLRERVLAQPGDPESRRRLAEACVAAGEHREAIRHLLQLQESGADDADLYDQFARAWSGLGLTVPAAQARTLATQRREAKHGAGPERNKG